MAIAYWIVGGLAALVFLAGGILKLSRPKDALQKSGLHYVEDLAPMQVKLIGLAELLGAIGLILPVILQVAPVLGPFAAIGLAIIMIGAIVVHTGRKEPVTINIALLLLTIAAAVLGFLIVL